MTEPLATPTHAHSGPGIKDALTKKIGPLPGIVWVLLIVLAVYAYRRFRAGKNAPTTASGVGTDALSTDSSPSTGGQSFTGGGSSSTQTSPVSLSNGQWALKVVAGMVGHGYSVSDINNAIAAYLNGQQLNPLQAQIVQAAIMQFGPPPEGLLPILTAPVVSTPAPATAPPKPTIASATSPVSAAKPIATVTAPKPAPRTYTVKSGDNLSSIAQHFYGTPDWSKIYNANKAVIGPNPNLIHAGMVLVIPT